MVTEEHDPGEDDQAIAGNGEQLQHHDAGALDDEEGDHVDEEAQQRIKGEEMPRLRQVRKEPVPREARQLDHRCDGPCPGSGRWRNVVQSLLRQGGGTKRDGRIGASEQERVS